ncbi:MAG: tRNA (adenosine(37)-N6)-threonylcarbamoyltransferase complex dimerization subunit type 1 TsaB [Acidimicrobiales bacterium]
MNILAIETATGSVGVALAMGGGVVAELTVRAGRRHVELLHPAIEHVCALSGVSLRDLEAVAVDVGPGLFTGIRVGVAAAKALAMALGIKAVAVTSLEAIRAAAVEAGAPPGAVVPVVDLRRGEVAWSLRDEVAWGEPAELVAAAKRAPGAGELVFAGEGAHSYAELFESSSQPDWRVAGASLASPPVASVAVLALRATGEGRVLDPARLAPCYLREADARINWTTRHDGPVKEGE